MRFCILAIAAAMLTSTGLLGAEPAPARFVSKPEFAALFSQLEKADAVVEGAARPKSLVYVLFDANCFYCHLTWKALQSYERVGLQVRWVPVAYQQASSVGRAGAIMDARDRVAALRMNELNYDAAHYDGGIPPVANVPSALQAALNANTALMRKFGAPGTPVTVWKDQHGDIRVKIGMPRLSELPAITGLPEQKITDNELAKFR